MFNILKLFTKNQFEQNLLLIYKFAFEASEQEAISIFNKNKSHCQIENSVNTFYNHNLNTAINNFFSLYKTVSCEEIIFSQKFVAPYLYDETFYTIGKDSELLLIVKINKEYVFCEDDIGVGPNDPDKITIYNILIGEILKKKYAQCESTEVLKMRLQQEISI